MEDDRHRDESPPPIPARSLPASATAVSRRFLLASHQCLYFADREARTQLLHPYEPRCAEDYATLARAGFRRSGPDIYRPRCGACQACIPTRVAVERFRYGRRFRRVLKKNADLSVGVRPAEVDDACFDLYARYIRGRHRDGEMYPPSRGQLDHIARSDWAGTFFLNAWLGDRLVATAVTDTHAHGLSAIYTFFDPDLSDRSLGVFAILEQVEECRRRGLPHLYLGFWIAESPKMRYKIDYQPLQLLVGGSWREVEPVAGSDSARLAPA